MYYTNGNGQAIRLAMTGASLARRLREMTPAQRACSAADVDDGKVALVDLTAQSIAALHQVSVPYMMAAKRLSSAERDQVRRGQRSLVIPSRARPPAGIDYARDLKTVLAAAMAARGVDHVLDVAIEAEARTND
jgi:hypothetical protein